MKHILFALLLVFNCWSLNAQNWSWAQSAGGTESDCNFAAEVATDVAGNSYVTGYFFDTATFGPYTLVSSGDADIFVAKYDNIGNCLWAVKAGGSSSDQGRDISIDSIGNCYVTGFYKLTAAFDANLVSSYGGSDIFIAKFDGNNGDNLWVEKAGGTNSGTEDIGFGIVTDDLGNSYLTGVFSGTSTFGGHVLTMGGVFIAKYDANGICSWAVSSTNSGMNDIGNGITLSSTSNLYVTGYYFGASITLGNDTLYGSGNQDVFIAKLDTGGVFSWGRKVCGGNDQDFGREVCVDNNDNVYITGSFTRSNLFGETTTLTSTPFTSNNAFLVKFNSAGIFQWVESVPTTSFGSIGHGIAYSENSNSIFLGGLFGGTATIGSEEILSLGTSNGFVANFDTSGTCNWAINGGEGALVAGYGIDIDSLDNTYMVGYFTSTVDFGTNSITSAGNSDLFIAKLDTSNNTVSIEEANSGYELSASVFPNPTKGIVTLDLSKYENEVHYIVTTVEGKIVDSGKTIKDYLIIDLTIRNRGIYFVSIINNNKSTTHKINKL